jgi:hypothetical protein
MDGQVFTYDSYFRQTRLGRKCPQGKNPSFGLEGALDHQIRDEMALFSRRVVQEASSKPTLFLAHGSSNRHLVLDELHKLEKANKINLRRLVANLPLPILSVRYVPPGSTTAAELVRTSSVIRLALKLLLR